MSFLSRTNSFVEQVRGFIHRPAHHVKQNAIELGSVDTLDILGSSFHKAAISGSRRALKKVLLSATCVDYPNNRGQTPLFCACARDNETNALLLLEYGANPNEKSHEGATPVHAACYVGNIGLLGKLIEAGGDLRLHDNEGCGVQDWALLNSDPKHRSKMVEFLNRTHLCAMAYIGEAATVDTLTQSVGRSHKQTSLKELMKMRAGTDSTFENLKRVQSMGFGKVYLGGDFSGGIISVVPLVSEGLLESTDHICFQTGFGTFIEQMKWSHMHVSVKKVRARLEPEEGIDNIIAEAEFLGKLRHPHIVLLMGICQSASLHDMWLVLEHLEQATLHHFLHHSKSSVDLTRKHSILGQVCNAMEFIHNQSLIHCGLSSMAIYLVSPFSAKVGNFEFMVESVKADLGKASRVARVSHGKLLYNWMAPELMREEPPHFSSDIYSICCIVWEMFTGEVPWAALEAQDIYHQVVVESVPLDLNCAALPHRFKALISYGLELDETKRLHKFSLFSQWLRSEQIPQFCRSHSSLHMVNRSSNHVESTSSSSPSSSLLSLSSKQGAPMWDSPHTNKCELDVPPMKPPRSFSYVPSVERQRAYQSLQQRSASTIVAAQKRESVSQQVSPTRIKPASHLYHYGVVGETCPAALPRQAEEDWQETEHCEPAATERFPCTVRSMAHKYQHIQSQHQLRQAILKGSMAPGGSCNKLWTSLESIKTATDSLDSDADQDLVLMSQGGGCKGGLGSLNSTPHLRSSSTPKGSTLQASTVPGDMSRLCHNQQPTLDSSLTGHRAEEERRSTPKEPDIVRRRAFIDSVWQNYLNVEDKESSASPTFQYRSPLLKFHTPNEKRGQGKCRVATGPNISIVSAERGTNTHTRQEHAKKPASEMTSLFEKSSLMEEDSLWTITSLGLKEDESVLKESSAPDIFNILHADYPSKGFRVLVKAEGTGTRTEYYQQSSFRGSATSRLEPLEVMVSREDGLKTGPGEKLQGVHTSTSYNTARNRPEEKLSKDHNLTFTLGSGCSGETKANPTWHYLTLDKDRHLNADTTSSEGRDGQTLQQDIHKTVPSTGHQMAHQPMMKHISEDFEFSEYYIDDDLTKVDHMNQMQTLSRFPQQNRSNSVNVISSNHIANNDQKAADVSQDLSKAINIASENHVANSQLPTQSCVCLSVDAANPPSGTENSHRSAVEVEAARQRVLGKRSASEKDLCQPKGVHLIASSRSGWRGQDRGTGKSGGKQAAHGLRSGQSDPSLSLSVVRDEKTDNTSSRQEIVKETTLAGEQRNTLVDAHRDILVDVQGDTQADIQRNMLADVHGNMLADVQGNTLAEVHGNTLADAQNTLAYGQGNTLADVKWTSLAANQDTSEAEEGTTTVSLFPSFDDMETRVSPVLSEQTEKCKEGKRKEKLDDSDSLDSDVWVKAKLSDIRNKIHRRKQRPEYTLSSDEEEGDCSHKLWSVDSTSLCAENPTSRTSLVDMGIHRDANYSKVMEQLKLTCRERNRPVPKLRTNTRKEPGKELGCEATDNTCTGRAQSTTSTPVACDEKHMAGSTKDGAYKNSSSSRKRMDALCSGSGSKHSGVRTEALCSGSGSKHSTVRTEALCSGSGSKHSGVRTEALCSGSGSKHSTVRTEALCSGSGSKHSGVRTEALCSGSGSKHSVVSFSPHRRSGHERQRKKPRDKRWSNVDPASSGLKDHELTVGLQRAHPFISGNKSLKANPCKQDIFGTHRFFLPRDNWPDGCRARLDVKVLQDSQHVTTTATNLASGQSETLLDQVVLATNLKSTLRLE